MPDVTLMRSEGELHTRFSPRLWTLFHDVPRLYEGILSAFERDGVTTSDIRPETGDGSLGGYSVGFWLPSIRGNVRFRVESAVLACAEIAAVDRSRLVSLIDSVLSTVRCAVPDIALLGHTITHSCHLRLETGTVAEYLGRFTQNPPRPAEAGPLLANGVAFHYGQLGPVLNTSITLERSLLFESAVFARTTLVLSGDVGVGEDILANAATTVLGVLRSAELILPELE